MRVVAFNGSGRKDGNTAILLKTVLEELEKEGIQTELVQLAGATIRFCRACHRCFEKKDQRCVMDDDIFNSCMEKIVNADGVLLGSPVYFADVSAELKAFIERVGFVSIANGHILKRKVGAGVIAVRRGGAVHTFNSINNFFTINQMIIPGSCYWNFAFGRDAGEVTKDEEGIHTMRVLGENMAWLLKKITA
jgi:multimeric flavodoxin WrbA